MTYLPPPGYKVALDFRDAASTPRGYRVALEFAPQSEPAPSKQLVFPAGSDFPIFGSPAVWFRVRTLTPAGLASRLGFGTTTLVNRDRIVDPLGFRADAHGQPRIENKDRYLTAGGLPPRLAFGLPTIFNADRYYTLAGFNAARFGAAFFQGGVVTVNVAPIAPPVVPSGAWVSRSPRTLAPVGVFREFPAQHMVGGTRWLEPLGFEATRWGTRIIPESQTAAPLGFSGAFGQAMVWNYRTHAFPVGFRTRAEDQRFGTTHAWNLRQFVRVAYDANDGLAPPPQGGWTAIANRNRVVSHHSTAPPPALIPRPLVELGARAILPAGIEAPGWAVGYKAGLVAYRIRYLPLDGVEAPYFSGWSKIHNAAPVVVPAGAQAAAYGTATVANTRRYFPYISAGDQKAMGFPMVAPRVRTLSFEDRYTIAPPIVSLPEAKLHTRYVDGIGYESGGVGHPSLQIHWARITPRWSLQHFFGFPALRNLTPELGQRGRNSEEFGDAFVRLQWRPVFTAETFTQRFGQARIADKRQRVAAAGLRATTVSDKLVVTKTGAPPYTAQYVWLDAEAGEGHGIPVPGGNLANVQVPRPVVSQQVVYVRQDAASTLYGTPRVTANSIRVEPGYQELTVGEPWVSLRIRRVMVGPFSDQEVFEPSRARVSPHTIYAVMEAPALAKTNHPTPIGLHYVDGRGREPGAIFGAARVDLRHRRIRPGGTAPASAGQPRIFNRRVYVLPTGIASMRFGWHEVPGPREVTQFDSVSAARYGTPLVARPPYRGPQTVKPMGFAGAIGPARVEYFNRELRPNGFDGLRMGSRLLGDSPFMWQGLRVGPLVRSSIGAGLMSRYGTPWISLCVREVNPAGFDGFASDYQLEAFEQRMRVWRREQRAHASIMPVGFDAARVPVPGVRPGARYIRPDGNAEQFRKAAAGVT